MKKLKSVIFIMVLSVVTLSTCAFAKSPLLLLQEGVYAEETEGDLDKAISLYAQVIEQAGEVERIGAKAAYKLGMCYLKKDDKESAAKYFQSVVEKYPSQTAYINKAKEQLEKLNPQPKELPLFAQVPADVLGYLSEQYAVVGAEAEMKKLKVNNNIFYLSPHLKLYRGGYGFYQQATNSITPDRIRLGGTTYPDQSFYDVAGNEMKVEIEDRPSQPGYYDIYWKPSMQLPQGQPFYYGWCLNKSKTINKAEDGTHSITMQNKFGSPVLEVFFLVLPEGFTVSQQSEDFTKKETVASYDIYQWKKEVPASTNHIVNVTLKKNANSSKITDTEAAKTIITEAVTVISTLPDGDPRIPPLLQKVAGIEDDTAIKMLAEYLDSPVSTIRRAAIYIFWKSNYNGIGPAAEKLLKLCSHEEEYTKGMAALALGATKEQTAFEKLCDMTINDQSSFARRCAAYALGLLSNADALPTLKKALNDEDINVKSNAEAAITMLTTLNKKEPSVSKAAKKQAEDLTAQGWQLWGQRKLVEAERAFKRAIKRDPTNDNAYQGLGWAQMNQGKKLNAKDTFEKCVELNPENSAALNGLGWIADGQGNKDEAIKWWEKAVEVSNGNATASLSGLTKAYTEKGDFEKAVKYYKTWLKVEPDSKDAKAGLREAEQGVRKIKAALKSALDWLELIDQGSYDQSWDNAAALFKIAVTRKQWETAAKAARGPLGEFIARVALSKTYTTQVPGGPDGEYVVITFKASFENKDSAVETVTPMLDDDGRWKVSGYYIK